MVGGCRVARKNYVTLRFDSMLASVVACASLLVSPAVVPRAPVARVASPVMAAAADDFVPDMQRRNITNLPKS